MDYPFRGTKIHAEFSIKKLSIQKQQNISKLALKRCPESVLGRCAEELEEELKKRMRGK